KKSAFLLHRSWHGIVQRVAGIGGLGEVDVGVLLHEFGFGQVDIGRLLHDLGFGLRRHELGVAPRCARACYSWQGRTRCRLARIHICLPVRYRRGGEDPQPINYRVPLRVANGSPARAEQARQVGICQVASRVEHGTDRDAPGHLGPGESPGHGYHLHH
ncbi:MAG: hypothetical protein Q6370_014500, partial [Candidatus Sigynarchaeota archaeon]